MTPEQKKYNDLAELEGFKGIFNGTTAASIIANGGNPAEVDAARQAAVDRWWANKYSAEQGEQAKELSRQRAYSMLAGDADPDISSLQTKYTAEVPWKFSEMNSAQAAQMANNGLSGSGLASRAARQSGQRENDAWNSGMSQAKNDYRDAAISNRSMALKMLQDAGDNEGQLKAEEAIKRANRANEKATTKTGAQNAYEIVGGVRNGMSGDNGVF